MVWGHYSTEYKVGETILEDLCVTWLHKGAWRSVEVGKGEGSWNAS
jgi:hypothetical protein